jgi:nicotinate dehydrogenase subunit A
MNGMVMGAKALLDKNPHPTPAEIKHALNNYICRCGSHLRVIRAIQRASGAQPGRSIAGAVSASSPRA